MMNDSNPLFHYRFADGELHIDAGDLPMRNRGWTDASAPSLKATMSKERHHMRLSGLPYSNSHSGSEIAVNLDAGHPCRLEIRHHGNPVLN
jgi:hypothetical protein